MPSHWAEQYIARHVGPLAVVRACKVPGCKFSVCRRLQAGVGRGSGMREGNKQRGVLIQHVKSAHPELAPGKV